MRKIKCLKHYKISLKKQYLKAVFKGFANKNARMWLGYDYGELESQWQARFFQYCGRNDFYVSYKPSTNQFVTKVQFVGKKELTDFII